MPAANAAVEVIALTSRDDFLLDLGQLLDGSASIMPVESSALALEAAGRSRRVQVLVIDSRDIADVRAEVDVFHTRAASLTALVFASEEAEVRVAAALKGSGVFAVLPLPFDARKTEAVFEGAVADAETRQAAARVPAQPVKPGAVTARPAGPPRGESARPVEANAGEAGNTSAVAGASAGGLAGKRVAAGVACALVAAAAAWLLMRKDTPVTASPEPAPQTATAPEETDAATDMPAVEALPPIDGSVDELLEKARVAMRERRYTEPASNSALAYYRSAAHADPGNAEALDGLNRLRLVIIDRFDELAKAGQYDNAAVALAQLQSALPSDPSIVELRLRLASARIAKAIEEGDAERATALVRSAQAITTVPPPQLAKWRSEIARVSEMAKQERVAEQKARDAAAEQKARDARAADAQRKAQLAREQESAKRLEAERAAQSAVTAAQSAATAANAGQSASQRVEPKLKRSARPEFPSDALKKGLSGIVTVAYTVDIEGKTQDVRVVSADPPEVFDRAATAAVRRWRYEPATVDGVPVEARLSIAIRFAQPK